MIIIDVTATLSSYMYYIDPNQPNTVCPCLRNMYFGLPNVILLMSMKNNVIHYTWDTNEYIISNIRMFGYISWHSSAYTHKMNELCAWFARPWSLMQDNHIIIFIEFRQSFRLCVELLIGQFTRIMQKKQYAIWPMSSEGKCNSNKYLRFAEKYSPISIRHIFHCSRYMKN